MKSLISTLALIILPSFVMGQEKVSDSEKIDSIFGMQKQLVRTIKNDPLENKNFGVELNLFRLLLLDKDPSISGGFSLFSVHRKAELSFPFLYSRSKNDMYENDENNKVDRTFIEFTQDAHYRYFLGNTQNGFYLSGFGRYAYLNGKLQNTYDNAQGMEILNNKRDTESKFGIGFGLGYRIFSYSGFYWGSSASFGRYLIGKNDRFDSGYFDLNNDSKFIFDVELMKFGYAF